MATRSFPILVIAETTAEAALFSSGLIARLAEEVPNGAFTIVAGEESAPLLAATPRLERMIVWPDGRWFRLWGQLRHRHWGLLLDLRGAPLTPYLRARRRAVRKGRRAGDHPVAAAAHLLKLDDDPPAPRLFVGPEAQLKAAQKLQGRRPILAVAPGADWSGKTWPVERFSRLGQELLAQGGPLAGGALMVLGGPDETRAGEDLRKSLPRERVIDLTEADLMTAYAALHQARLFLGNEGIMMHLAAAAGAPTLGLFGPSDEKVRHPWGHHTRVVRGSRGFEHFLTIDPNLNQHIGHMVDLTVESVRRAAYELLAATEPPSHA